MKITTFDPMIVSPKAVDVIKVFEDLGFEKTHAPVTQTEAGEVTSVRLKDPNGFHVGVTGFDGTASDMVNIRMNVDNFQEAYNILIAHGFKNTRGDKVLNTKSAKATTMVAPSGFVISLVEHIKNHD